jgi:hypothetical protein
MKRRPIGPHMQTLPDMRLHRPAWTIPLNHHGLGFRSLLAGV